jgi:hypothetical protein
MTQLRDTLPPLHPHVLTVYLTAYDDPDSPEINVTNAFNQLGHVLRAHLLREMEECGYALLPWDDLKADPKSPGWVRSHFGAFRIQLTDRLGNRVAREGCDRCWCGCKYWENDRCIDCGSEVPTAYNHAFKTFLGLPPAKGIDQPVCGVDLPDSWDFAGADRPPCPRCQALTA